MRLRERIEGQPLLELLRSRERSFREHAPLPPVRPPRTGFPRDFVTAVAEASNEYTHRSSTRIG